jgi:hypothetical protein
MIGTITSDSAPAVYRIDGDFGGEEVVTLLVVTTKGTARTVMDPDEARVMAAALFGAAREAESAKALYDKENGETDGRK